MNIKRSLSFFHYNIGFIKNFKIPNLDSQEIEWMKHSFKDRFFADPFILKYTDTEIHVLVEEFIYKKWKGHISLLVIDRYTLELKRIKKILVLTTHLSFPFIFRVQNEIFIIPENAQSSSLKVYLYDEKNEKLTYASTILNTGVIDPVILFQDNVYYLLGGIRDKNPNECLYMWYSDHLLGEYKLCLDNPVKIDKSCARRAGGVLQLGNTLYTPTQVCKNSYGEAIELCRITSISRTKFSEESIARYNPHNLYPNGLHTLNVHRDLCVVDGLTYLFSPLPKILTVLKRKYVNK